MYQYIRARQLEGTFPGSHEIGNWITTTMRISAGWGSVEERFWPYTGRVEDWPPTEPGIDLDEIAKQSRISCYQRVRSVDDARRVIAGGNSFVAAFRISSTWFNAHAGAIDIDPENQLMNMAHTVHVCGYDHTIRRLRFANSWGVSWGDDGYGSMSYEYFSKFMTEAWSMIPSFDENPRPQIAGDKIVLSVFGLPDITNENVLHCVDLHLGGRHERFGWGFALQTDKTLEIEELFVKPSFRRKGWASKILDEFQELSVTVRLPLIAWVPHVDNERNNLTGADHLFARLGCHRRLSKKPWASWKFDNVGAPLAVKASADSPSTNRPGLWFADLPPNRESA